MPPNELLIYWKRIRVNGRLRDRYRCVLVKTPDLTVPVLE
jgi:hypothetical protein